MKIALSFIISYYHVLNKESGTEIARTEVTKKEVTKKEVTRALIADIKENKFIF